MRSRQSVCDSKWKRCAYTIAAFCNLYIERSNVSVILTIDPTKVTIQGTVAKPEAKKIAIIDGGQEIAFTYIISSEPCKFRIERVHKNEQQCWLPIYFPFS